MISAPKGTAKGAVAGGSPQTVEAGLFALKRGGNAVDAAIAASLMACVAEPLLTGLGGAGLATVLVDGRAEVVDFFTAKPGQGRAGDAPRPQVDELLVDFGPTTQIFHVGPGTVATPGLPAGLWEMHQRWGHLSMEELAAPAIEASQMGVPCSPVMARVAALLAPILRADPEVAAWFSPDGVPVEAGQLLRCPALGDTLRRYAHEGPGYIYTGEWAERCLESLGSGSSLTAEDLRHYKVDVGPALHRRHHDAELIVPGPPSLAGLLILKALSVLEDSGPLPPPLTGESVLRLVEAQLAAEDLRSELNQKLFDPGFLSRALAELGRGAGFTTHISTVDGEGSAVSITHSLGETCGRVVPGTGVLLNNFLGEADVNPPDGGRAPGQRLFTMCCPSLLRWSDRVAVLGTGGSNRIRSAVLHGVVYLVDRGLSPEQAVRAPRAHVERGLLHVETAGRPADAIASLLRRWPDLRRFDEPDLFFGGLHVVQLGPEGFRGAGDPRRCGAFGVA